MIERNKQTMKRIAVTYDNGQVFQHFGRTEAFKVYEVEDGNVVNSEIVESNGVGHGALAVLLNDNNIDVLICGGLGGGAMAALEETGIEVCACAQGNTDEVVESYLKGELVSEGVNCDHHGEGHSCGNHEEGHSCGGHGEGHSCGGHEEEHSCGENEEDNSCEGCHGGCHGGCGNQIIIEGKNAGKTVKAHYKGTFNDGTQFDSSYDRGEPLEFVCGVGMMIRGFDAAVANMEVGEIVDIHLMPEEAYGMPDPQAIFTVEIADMPGSEDLQTGDRVYLSNPYGQQFPVTVTAKDDTNITFDANHEMAGKELNFRIELVEVQES